MKPRTRLALLAVVLALSALALTWFRRGAASDPIRVGVLHSLTGTMAISERAVVDATLVAGGIKVALITTAAGLTIAIPVNVAHNYFVSKIDSMVIEMEEASQNLVETLHAMGREPAARGA